MRSWMRDLAPAKSGCVDPGAGRTSTSRSVVTSNRPSHTLVSPARRRNGFSPPRAASPISRRMRIIVDPASIRAPARVATKDGVPVRRCVRLAVRGLAGGRPVPPAQRQATDTKCAAVAGSASRNAAREISSAPAPSTRQDRASVRADGALGGGGRLGPPPIAWRARGRAKAVSSLAGSSIQVSPRARSQSRISARRAPSIGRSRKMPRPSGQAGEGDQVRGSGVEEPASRMARASRQSSAVWPNRMTRAPTSRAAFASKT